MCSSQALRGIILLLASLGAVVPSSAVAQLPIVAGIYSNDAQNIEAVKAGVKPSADSAPFLFRSIVRKGLMEVNPAYRRVSFEQEANAIILTFDTDKPIKLPVDGSAFKWTNNDGDPISTSAAWQDGQFVLTSISEKAKRINAFRWSEDGRDLTMSVTMTIKLAPTPIQYQLVFRRE